MVEIGTGCGVSGVWLLRGMRLGGVLTSIDAEPENQRLARAAFLAAGFPANRYRLIAGLALDLLPRLADEAYDLVFCDADRPAYPSYLAESLRLLRTGGVLLFDDGLPPYGPAKPWTQPESTAVAEVREAVRTDERLVPLLLPIGPGLLAAVKRAG